MTCQNGVWDGNDLTHPFLDDRSTVVRGPSVHTTIEQEATLQIPLANSSRSSARVHSEQSSATPSARSVTAPDMSHRTPSEQDVIQALQAVANYPESRDFVETVSRRLPGLQTLLDAPAQLEGCLTTRRDQGPGSSAAMRRAQSPIPGLSLVSDEELGRKQASPHELSGAAGTNESPTSRPPSKKPHGVLRSVVIQKPHKVGYRGTPEPLMAMSEVIERYAPSPASVLEGTDNSVQSRSSSTAKAAKTITAYYPPSEKMSGSVVTRDANRIWHVAPWLNDRQFRDRQRAPPSSAD